MESPPKITHDSFTFRFPARLWRIINSCTTGSISWGPNGKTIRILRKKFEEEYLTGDAKPFKTSKYESFVRQLNHYGFKKVKKRCGVKKINTPILRGESKEDAAMLSEYHNPNFTRGNPERVTFLERRSQMQEEGGHKKRHKRTARAVMELSQLGNQEGVDVEKKIKKETSKSQRSLMRSDSNGASDTSSTDTDASSGKGERGEESSSDQLMPSAFKYNMMARRLSQSHRPLYPGEPYHPMFGPGMSSAARMSGSSSGYLMPHRPYYSTDSYDGFPDTMPPAAFSAASWMTSEASRLRPGQSQTYDDYMSGRDGGRGRYCRCYGTDVRSMYMARSASRIHPGMYPEDMYPLQGPHMYSLHKPGALSLVDAYEEGYGVPPYMGMSEQIGYPEEVFKMASYRRAMDGRYFGPNGAFPPMPRGGLPLRGFYPGSMHPMYVGETDLQLGGDADDYMSNPAYGAQLGASPSRKKLTMTSQEDLAKVPGMWKMSGREEKEDARSFCEGAGQEGSGGGGGEMLSGEDPGDLPLDVVEETVITCNTAPAAPTPLMPYPGVEEGMMMEGMMEGQRRPPVETLPTCQASVISPVQSRRLVDSHLQAACKGDVLGNHTPNSAWKYLPHPPADAAQPNNHGDSAFAWTFPTPRLMEEPVPTGLPIRNQAVKAMPQTAGIAPSTARLPEKSGVSVEERDGREVSNMDGETGSIQGREPCDPSIQDADYAGKNGESFAGSVQDREDYAGSDKNGEAVSSIPDREACVDSIQGGESYVSSIQDAEDYANSVKKEAVSSIQDAEDYAGSVNGVVVGSIPVGESFVGSIQVEKACVSSIQEADCVSTCQNGEACTGSFQNAQDLTSSVRNGEAVSCIQEGKDCAGTGMRGEAVSSTQDGEACDDMDQEEAVPVSSTRDAQSCVSLIKDTAAFASSFSNGESCAGSIQDGKGCVGSVQTREFRVDSIKDAEDSAESFEDCDSDDSESMCIEGMEDNDCTKETTVEKMSVCEAAPDEMSDKAVLPTPTAMSTEKGHSAANKLTTHNLDHRHEINACV